MRTRTTRKSIARLTGSLAAVCLLASLAGGSIPGAQARHAAAATISGDVIFWNAYNTVSPENSTLITKVIPAFQKQYPNVTVYSQNIPYPSLLQKLVASIAG